MSNESEREAEVLRREEPAADVRAAAHGLRQLYVALRNEKFTERQSIAILGEMLAAARPPQGGAS